MAQFMLLLHDRPDWAQGLTPEGIESVIDEYRSWGGKLASEGKLLGGHKLTEEGGRHIFARGSDILVTDGPFAEAKEVMGGYFIIQAADYDEAVAIARTCPHVKYGRIELREVDPD